VGNIRLPTEIICGEADAITPVKYSNYLTRQIEGAHQDIIADADHFVQLKQYQQVNTKIEEFLHRIK
jgi:pimeloyl-ACP methyl ester carboxylesterase